jgi:predicted unusual protein kinase regulating ubiquinone biosynthesis (AarF/ABC1/UbiB family)
VAKRDRIRDGATRRALKIASVTAGVGGSYLGYLAQRLFLGAEARERKLKETHTKAAQRASDGLLTLRGPIMKLGQALSLHGDLLPEETLAELGKLQMRAPGMHPSLARAQFRSAMGRDPEDLFAAFDDVPFAAASLGQVHRATTRAGEAVAVKIQYPGIRAAIEGDFKWFRTVSRPAQASKYIPAGIIDELETQIIAEADYAREAANLTRFRRDLAPLDYVEVPKPFLKLSGDKVLTMSLLAGEHLDAFLARQPSQRLRDLVGERLLELFYFQILQLGAFHADPHWGNYLFRDDGTVGLVDFGCVKVIPPAFIENLRALFLYPGRRDSADFRRLVIERYAIFGQKVSDRTARAHTRFAQNFFAKVYPPEPEAEARAFDFGDAGFLRDYMRESANLMQAKAALPEYVFLARAEIGLYQTLHRLRARVHTSRIVRQYL